ncbi:MULTISPECIES: MobF family relaxase [unclassified Streptomyces]|uniref:MobF family relaxase n=1 Tax=unclassified Streptomyces TaxID=2593676 RepID=UPI000823E0C7|nr:MULTISPECIES: MobF family relaxase [unclassified Streptomyces]MYU02157.1 relaxase domain-containing protein [Streptomyces sp. SID8350]SCK61698.1 conjugative relaxase domain-containing protein, TrwC/TraI family [Streptomyces sp. AmelKG-D3]
MIGPSDEQVEYRLTGGHGCGKSTTVDAAPLVAAIEAKAEAAGAPVASLLPNREAKRAYFRAHGVLRSKGAARFTGFDAVEVAAAAGLDARDLYGEEALPPRSADGQVDYHLDASERPLVWIGNGLAEFDITPGSVLAPEQFPAARRLMHGEDPRTGQTLVEPKLAIAPAAKLPAAPLVRAIRRAAAERSVKPASLLDSKRKQDAFRRMESQLKRFGESHRVPVSTVLKLADAVGIDAVDLYGEDVVEKAVAAEAGGHLDARALLRAVEARATETGQQPADLFDAASMKRRYTQTEGEGGRRLRDLPMDVREAVAMAKAAGLTPEDVWDAEEIKAALLEGRVQVGNFGADVTLDLSKSKSALLAYAPEEIAAQVESIYTAAGRESIGALERWTAYAMRGHHGDGDEAETVETSGFSGWMMIHRAARPVDGAPYGDPHFHLHFTLANMVKGADGKWSTMASGGRDLHRHTRATQSLMNARIRRELTDTFGISFRREERTGAWEIAAIPESTIKLFSKRDSQVRDLLTKLGIDYDSATTRERTAASTASKAAKNAEVGVGDDVLRAYWQAEGRAAGDDPDAIAASAMEQDRADQNPTLDELCKQVFDPKTGLTSHSKEFTHAAAIAAVLDALPYGVADADEAEQLTNSVLRNAGYAVQLNPKGAQHFTHADRYTTADVVAAEALIVSEATNRLGTQAAVVSSDTVDMTLSTVEAQHGGSFTFSDEQRAVLERLLTAGHGIDAVVGIAGSGKTTIMDTARQAWEAHGLVIAGASTAAVAAANLKAEAGIESRTVASWLTGIRNGGSGLTGVDVLVLDEAAMCDDRDIAELLTHAAETGTKIVGIGDPKQLHSPGIGGSFAAVHHLVGGLTLSQNFRQKDMVERRALELWRDDNRVESLRTYAGTGRVHALADKDTTLAAMLTIWADKRAAHTDDHTAVQQLLMLAATNEIVEELNTGARALRKENGDLTGPEHTFALPGGGELALSVGDQVLLRINDYRGKKSRGQNENVLNGYRGLVRAVDEERRVLVEWREKTEDGHRDVAEWVDADYIAQGGLSLGYAITGHKSQGLTVQEALVYGPGAQANALYTMMSRDKKESHLFLPLSVYETDADRARHGDVLTDQEQLDRAVAGLIREIENGTEERMILTELPTAAVPAHVRQVVADLPTPRAPGADEHYDAHTPEQAPEHEGSPPPANAAPTPTPTTPSEPAPTADRPYAHLGSSALRDAVRKAAIAARATATAADKAEAAADRAAQEAAAGAGPRSLALQRRHQDVAERAVAIRDVRALTGTIADRTAQLNGTETRIEGLDQQLAATGRFGRAALRGDERASVEADREALLRVREETVQELEQMDARLQEATRQAGPVNEREDVLTEAEMPQQEKAALLRRAKAKDNEAAKQLRAEATKARSTAHGADHRVFGLQKETRLRAQHGHRHVDGGESDVPSCPKPESPYANRTTVDHTQPVPPDGTHDAPPV